MSNPRYVSESNLVFPKTGQTNLPASWKRRLNQLWKLVHLEKWTQRSPLSSSVSLQIHWNSKQFNCPFSHVCIRIIFFFLFFSFTVFFFIFLYCSFCFLFGCVVFKKKETMPAHITYTIDE